MHRVGGAARGGSGALTTGGIVGRSVARTPCLTFGDQRHRAETYKSGRAMSSAFCPRSDFGPFRTGQSPCTRRESRKWRCRAKCRLGDSPTEERERSVSALDERVRERDAEAALRVGQAFVLAVVAVALGMREDHDPVGVEGRQRVLDRDRGLALTGVAGGVDALFLEPLDGLLLRALGLPDRLVGVRDPERHLGLVGGGGDDEHLGALDVVAHHGAEEIGVDGLGRQDEQLHVEAATPGSSATNGTASGGDTRRTTTATSSRTLPPCTSSTASSMWRAVATGARPWHSLTTRASCSGPKRWSTGLASITPSV